MDNVDLNFRMMASGNAVPELRKAQQGVKNLGNQIDRTQRRMRGFNNGITKMQASTRKFSMGVLQQAGYQFGDYAVQVANGTSKMQAFGQQAPQLLQIFGPIGAIVGAGVAIFAAFAVALERTSSVSSDAAKAIKSIEESTKDAAAEVQMLTEGLRNLQEVPVQNEIKAANAEIITQQARILALEEEKLTASRSRVKLIEDRLIPSIRREIDRQRDIIVTNQEILEQGREQDRLREQAKRRIQNEQDAYSRMMRVYQNSRMAISREQEARKQAHLSLVAAYGAELRINEINAQQREIIARSEAQRTLEISNQYVARTELQAAKQTAAYAGYYQSRVAGENMVARAAELAAAAPQVGRSRGRGGPTAEEVNLFNLKAQLAKSEADFRESLEKMKISGIKKEADAIKNELSPAMKQLQTVQESVTSSFENGFMSIVDGTNSAKDAFKSMASEMIKELYRIFVVKRITGMIGGFFNMNQVSGPSMPLGTGNIRPVMRPPSANGGGYTGNGARAGGLDGKGGFMAMIHPRETVVDHTKGQGMGGVTVIQNNTFQSGVTRSEVSALLPKMVEASKAAVLDAKRQGGSYGKAFA